jgi:Second Longin domain of FUZ, MON1 and HPS1
MPAAILQDCSAMYGVLLCDAGIVALASQSDQPRLHPSDLLLLATFLRANDSLRQVRLGSCFDICANVLWVVRHAANATLHGIQLTATLGSNVS